MADYDNNAESAVASEAPAIGVDALGRRLRPKIKTADMRAYRLKKSREWRKKYPYYYRQKYQEKRERYIAEARLDRLIRKEAIREARVRKENAFGHISRAQAMARRMDLAGLLHPEANESMIAEIYLQARRLTRCTGIRFDVDHIIPSQARGWHHHHNLQALPIGLNASKSANPLWEHDCFRTYADVPRNLWPERIAPALAAMCKEAA